MMLAIFYISYLGGFYRSFYRCNSCFQFGYLLGGLILGVILLATRKWGGKVQISNS